MTQSSFRFAHLADLHLGSWRDNTLRNLSTEVFNLAIQRCIKRKYDFVLFAGDIFNTSLPAIDIVNHVAAKLQELKSANIPLYVIPGSHDFSPTGRSMIDVLESAGLLINVCKGSVNLETKQLELKQTIDLKTGAKITGILGRRGMLDRTYYENLARSKLEESEGYKIFLFHTTLTELKPKHLEMMESHAASFLPKNQNYYAGGHIHHKSLINLENYGPMTYTGALFPNNFAELEKYGHGGYYEITVTKKETENQFNSQIQWLPLKVKDHLALIINCTGKSVEQIHNEFRSQLESSDIKDKILTLRIHGKIGDLQIKDLNTSNMIVEAKNNGAHLLLVNTNKIERNEFTATSLALDVSSEQMELALIKEHLSKRDNIDSEKELKLIQDLMVNLDTQKTEGEKSYDFSTRILDTCKTLLETKQVSEFKKEKEEKEKDE
ncbi:hypothetical protein CL619_03520 [archaeon]|nr:hypothetical protein [archaeon]|tara:strand:- start:46 stop:1356 length:1311 start_codon:yes stop_codon:yes gene_type:complete